MTIGPTCDEQTSIPERWYDRWFELDDVLLAKSQAYQSVLLDPSGQQSFGDLFGALGKFGGGQFCHFYEGLAPEGVLQVAPVEAPRDYVLAVTLDQISNDLHVIERAANQHQAANQDPPSGTSTALKTALDTARRLAQHALEPVVGAGKLLAKMPIVIPYFQKSASIRIIPYADVVLIGLPLSAARVGRDYLVIPHEIGHYVYWHGRQDWGQGDEPVYRKLNRDVKALQSPPWVSKWTEEIFADTYGSMVGGPIITLSSQDLANQRSLNGFTADDNEHPTPAVRPFIYTEVLDRISQAQAKSDLTDSSQYLKVGWNDRLRKRGDPILPITLEKMANRVYEVVDQALSVLDPYVPLTRWSNDLVDILDATDPTKTDPLKVEAEYMNFVNNIPNLVPVPGFTTANVPETPSIWNDWVIGEKFYTPSPPWPVPAGTEVDLAHTPEDEWLYVLHAGGWTTEIGNHEGG